MNDKIRAAQFWSRIKVAWKVFFWKNWGAWSAKLADIYEGANRGEY